MIVPGRWSAVPERHPSGAVVARPGRRAAPRPGRSSGASAPTSCSTTSTAVPSVTRAAACRPAPTGARGRPRPSARRAPAAPAAPASARAISTRCCWPPESSDKPVAGAVAQAHRLQGAGHRRPVRSARPARRAGAGPAGRRPPPRATLAPPRRGGRALGDVADRRPAPERPQRLTEQLDRAALDGHQPEQRPDQRGLSRPVAAQQRHRLPGPHRQRDAAQHRQTAELDARPRRRRATGSRSVELSDIRWPSSARPGWTRITAR